MPAVSKLSPSDKRKHARKKTDLAGRYMLADRREYSCTVIDVSMTGVALLGPEHGKIGETVVAYVDQIGRIQGEIIRHIAGGFALNFTKPSGAAETFAKRLEEIRSRARAARLRRSAAAPI
jgi:hypothetical protein